MSLTRTVLGFLGSLALTAGLCAPVSAQYQSAGNQPMGDDNARAAAPAAGYGGCDGCGGCATGCGCCSTGCCNSGCCNSGCCNTACYDCWRCQSCCPHLYAAYESVFLTPHFSRNAAFYLDDPVAGAPRTFEEVTFDWDLEYSPRFEVGYLNPCGLGARVRYWTLDQSATESLTTNNNDIYASFSGSDDQATVEFDGVNSITATHSLELDVVDVEGIKSVCSGLLFSGGVRWVRMDQEYRAVDEANNVIAGHHDIDAFGLTGAIEFTQPVCGALAAFVKLRQSLVFGESSFTASAIDPAGLVTDQLLRTNEFDLISITELQVGAEWSMWLQSGSRLYVSAAGEAQYWHNAGTGLPGRHGTDDGNYIDQDAQEADMGLWGFNIGTGLIY